MANKMLIDATHPEETRVVVLRGNRVEEFDFETAHRKQLRGNIYLAKVTRVEPSLQAAFVDYGGNRHGFLAFSEIHPDYYQIPVADRQALIDEESRAHRDQDEDEDRRGGRRRSRHHSRDARRRDHTDDAVRGEAPSAAEHDDHGPEGADHDHQDAAHYAGEHPGDHGADHAGDHTSGSANDPTGSGSQENATSPTDEHADHQHRHTQETSSGEPSAEHSTAPAHLGVPQIPFEQPTAESAEAAAAPAWAEPQSESRFASEPHSPSAESQPEASHDYDSHESTEHAQAAVTAHGSSDQPDVSGFPHAGTDDYHPASDTSDASGHGHHDDHADGNGHDEEEEIVDTVGGADAMEEVMERAPRHRRQYKIQEVIKRRQVMLVQVVKEERGTKGAALTTYLSLAGRYSVLMPNTARGGGISRKITSAEDRKKLREIADSLEVPEGMGVILRTAGAARTKAEVKRDFEYLLRLWETVRDLTLKSTAATLVYEEGSLAKRSIRDLYSKDIEEIVVAGEQGYQDAKEFMRMLMPSHARNVKQYKDSQPLFTRYGIESQLDAMFSPTVQLRSGGYIVINQTEALVAIDVNSGRSTREHHIEDTALKTNVEAAEEIARQLRLRDLAGLIVIDFIDMDEKRNNRTVERRLKDALRNDRARIQVGRISHFGLMEMSRQRIRTSVLESSTEKCPHCGGTGHVRSVSSVTLQVLRAIEEILLKGATHNQIVRTQPEIALYILNHKRAHLTMLEQRFHVGITINADDTIEGTTSFAIDRGEQVLTVEQAKAIAEQNRASMPVLDEEPEEFVPENIEDETEESAEQAPESGQVLDAPSDDDEDDEDRPVRETGEQDGERSGERTGDREARGRRRRRRGRGGRGGERPGERGGERGGERVGERRPDRPARDTSEQPYPPHGETAYAAASDTEQPMVYEGAVPDSDFVPTPHEQNGGHPAAEGDVSDEHRRRRRGRRGGRRNRRDREAPREGENGSAAAHHNDEGATYAPPYEGAPPDNAYPSDAPASNTHQADTHQADTQPSERAADTTADRMDRSYADTPRNEEATPVERAPAASAPVERAPEPAPEAAPRRRSTVREPAPTSGAASAGTPAAAPTMSVVPNAMPASETASESPGASAPPESDKPRRTGWWAKRLLGGNKG